MPIVADIRLTRQLSLFTALEECLVEPLTDLQKDLIRRLDILRIEKHIVTTPNNGCGRKLSDRGSIGCAFIAKALYTIPTTKCLRQILLEQPVLRMLCGWEQRRQAPSEPTFSRAFAAFAKAALGCNAHLSRVRTYIGDTPSMHNGSPAYLLLLCRPGEFRVKNQKIQIRIENIWETARQALGFG